jgi:hypothetical protein
MLKLLPGLRLHTLQGVQNRGCTIIGGSDDGYFQLDIDYCRLIIVD